MKAKSWTSWAGYLPSTKVETRRGSVALCMQPWDHILPEEGLEERMGCTEASWRPWERYLYAEKEDAASSLLSGSRARRPESLSV